MPTPAHTDFDSNNPQGSQTPALFASSSLANMRALRDAITSGRIEGFIQSRTQGTGPDVARPQYISWINTALGIGFRWNLSWAGFQVASVTDEWSNDVLSTNTWTAINAAQVQTYDASNNITATTGAGGVRTLLLEVLTKTLKVVSDFAAHIGSSAVHGLASMAFQAANAVAIVGGAINGTPIGATTRSTGDFTRVTEAVNPATFTPTANAGVALDWSYGSSAITANGTNAITFVNVPAGSAGHLVYVDNFNAVTWPAAVSWGVSGRPSIAGAAWVSLYTNNAGVGTVGSIPWRAA